MRCLFQTILFVIFIAIGQCSSKDENFEECTRSAIYNSTDLRQQLGAETIEICSNSKGCERRDTMIGSKDDRDKIATDENSSSVIIAVVCTIVGLSGLIILGVLYARKKRYFFNILFYKTSRMQWNYNYKEVE